ncbi:MAG TPA: hypothetical protein VLC95_06290, partial [Anaerolineae bacterium]|nr:hypothetical protein [Anaerolineae bacterium]
MTREQKGTIGLLAAAFLLGVVYTVWLVAGAPRDSAAQATGDPGAPTVRPTRTARPTRTPRPSATPRMSPTPTLTPAPPRIGIVAGHWK